MKGVLLSASLLLPLGVSAQMPLTGRDMRQLLPPNTALEQFVVTRDSMRTYFARFDGGIWVYDRRAGATSRISADAAWDLTLSPNGDAIAYSKAGETRRDQQVWLMPLSRETGLPAGAERQLSDRSADAPAFSPDGKWVAFARDDPSGVGQSVVVVPTSGGRERVLAADMPAGVSAIHWTPDGKTLYFGVNPPVPFTCAESCLSGAHDTRPPATIRRVALDGGAAETVTNVGGPLLGLSPDGSVLVFRDTGAGTSRRIIVADVNGTRRGTFTLAGAHVPHTWLGGSTMLTLATAQVRRLRSVRVSGGESRLLVETPDFVPDAAWSPDGRLAVTSRFTLGSCVLQAMNPDGSAPHEVGRVEGNCFGATWTSDQRAIVFADYRPNGGPTLAAADPATGQTRVLRTFGENVPAWTLDGDVIVLNEQSDSAGVRLARISQMDLSGNVTLLREIRVDRASAVTLVDRRSAIVVRGTPFAARVVPLTPSGGEGVTLTAPTVFPRATVSADRQWVAFFGARPGEDSTRLTRVELLRLDGSAHRSIDLPFAVTPATNGVPPLLVLGGATGIIAVEPRKNGQQSSVYFVDAATSKATELFTYMSGYPQLSLSPDQHTLLYLVSEVPPPSVSAIDISTVVR